ncbi:MAG: hypothetical protein HYV09_18595 [Deltaproteobacteria bacterium]|nr:hypothetical protein [Deltaproteobacteria bacterium]
MRCPAQDGDGNDALSFCSFSATPDVRCTDASSATYCDGRTRVTCKSGYPVRRDDCATACAAGECTR